MGQDPYRRRADTTDETNRYFHIPWANVGVIEKAVLRGLRIEVIGAYKDEGRHATLAGDIRCIEDSVFVYTIPQLNNRDNLIDNLIDFKRCVEK